MKEMEWKTPFGALFKFKMPPEAASFCLSIDDNLAISRSRNSLVLFFYQSIKKLSSSYLLHHSGGNQLESFDTKKINNNKS